MKLIKVDKNGTKYYVGDCKCRNCGGLGGSDRWVYTGWTCYRCGGSGIDPKPETVKEYTPEYEAKLNARREKREEEKRLKRVAEFNECFDEKLAELGFGANHKAYVVKGNTYNIKEALKEAGARYRLGLNWYFAEPNDDYDTFEVDYTECLDIYPEYGKIDWKGADALKKLVEAQPTETSASEFVGEIGQKVKCEVVLDHVGQYSRQAYRGWGTEIVFIYTFCDNDGNAFVWKTSKGLVYNEGNKVLLTGTIKEHSEYKGIKQTVLQRCKVEVV